MDHPTRELPGDALARGTIRLRIYGRPDEELGRVIGERVPRWVQRLYESYGADLEAPPLSASMEAVAEGLGHRLEGMALILRKAEARGWKVAIEGDELAIYTGIADDDVRALLEADGVLTLVQEFTHREEGP